MSLLEKLNQPIGKASKSKKSLKQKPDIDTGGFARVSLMPESHRKAKEKDAAKAQWIKIVIIATAVTAVLVGAAFAWSFYNSHLYEQQAQAERDSEAQLEEYSEISDMLSSINQLENIADNVMSTSVEWNGLMEEINSGLPDTSRMTTFAVASGNPQSDGTSIIINASIVSQEPLDYADVIYSVPGTTNAQLGNLSGSAAGSGREYIYDISFGFDTQFLENVEDEDDESTGGTTDADNGGANDMIDLDSMAGNTNTEEDD